MFANPQAPEPNATVIGLDNHAGTGALASSSADVGGSWSEIGGGTSYQRTGGGIIRNPGSTDGAFKFARLGSSNQAAIYARATLYAYGGGAVDRRGILLRYTDASNYTVLFLSTGTDNSKSLLFWAVKAGVIVLAQATTLPGYVGDWDCSIAIAADGSGLVAATGDGGSVTRLLGWPANSDLATGGTLATGGFGLAHQLVSGTYIQGSWTNVEFRSLTGSTINDAVIFPGRSAILSHDNALRYDSAGTSLGEIGRYQGDRLTVPAGASSRIAILDGRVAPGSTDNNLDQFTADVSLIPRVVDVPEPA